MSMFLAVIVEYKRSVDIIQKCATSPVIGLVNTKLKLKVTMIRIIRQHVCMQKQLPTYKNVKIDSEPKINVVVD